MNRRALPLFTLAVLLLVSALAAGSVANAAPSQPEAGWVTLMAEGFEGAFPSPGWHIGREGAPYLWGQRDCNPHRGAYSMWGGGGGPWEPRYLVRACTPPAMPQPSPTAPST